MVSKQLQCIKHRTANCSDHFQASGLYQLFIAYHFIASLRISEMDTLCGFYPIDVIFGLQNTFVIFNYMFKAIDIWDLCLEYPFCDSVMYVLCYI